MSQDQPTPEAMQAFEQVVEQASAVLVYACVRALTEAGAKPASAFRLAAAMVVSNALGDDGFKTLGVSRATWYRWKAEIRALNVDMPEEPPAEYLIDVAGLLGHPLG